MSEQQILPDTPPGNDTLPTDVTFSGEELTMTMAFTTSTAATTIAGDSSSASSSEEGNTRTRTRRKNKTLDSTWTTFVSTSSFEPTPGYKSESFTSIISKSYTMPDVSTSIVIITQTVAPSTHSLNPTSAMQDSTSEPVNQAGLIGGLAGAIILLSIVVLAVFARTVKVRKDRNEMPFVKVESPVPPDPFSTTHLRHATLGRPDMIPVVGLGNIYTENVNTHTAAYPQFAVYQSQLYNNTSYGGRLPEYPYDPNYNYIHHQQSVHGPNETMPMHGNPNGYYTPYFPPEVNQIGLSASAEQVHFDQQQQAEKKDGEIRQGIRDEKVELADERRFSFNGDEEAIYNEKHNAAQDRNLSFDQLADVDKGRRSFSFDGNEEAVINVIPR